MELTEDAYLRSSGVNGNFVTGFGKLKKTKDPMGGVWADLKGEGEPGSRVFSGKVKRERLEEVDVEK